VDQNPEAAQGLFLKGVVGMINRADVLIIGGGAAGLMAAGQAAGLGAQVVVLEKNPVFGKKILVTGKGRCNVTNDCDMNEFQRNMPGNGRFLYSAFSRFDSRAVQEFFRGQGVPLKVERGRRVFPVSDRAEDIRAALERFARTMGVTACSGKPRW
jgi:predicted Rossmann fold flavoprotein